MKYNIHDTKALVLKSRPHKEDSLLVLLLTREFGCLYALAQGARKSSSKIRAGLVESSYISVGLLAGKGGWRVTYLVPYKNILFSLRKKKSSQVAVSKIMSVCSNLIGEGGDSNDVFDTTLNGFLKMINDVEKGVDHCDNERFLMLKILYVLGYIEHSAYLSFIKKEEFLMKEGKQNLMSLRRNMNKEINRALDIAL